MNASQSNPALNKLLQANARSVHYRGHRERNNAGYQPGRAANRVMAIGGFNGTDPAPTLSQFERYVAEGRSIITASGGGLGMVSWWRRGGGTSDDASQITSWVESHFTSETVGGVTVYNLSTAS